MGETGRTCENCGMTHEPEDTASCIEGHGDDPIQVTIHGTYGRVETCELCRRPITSERHRQMVERRRLLASPAAEE